MAETAVQRRSCPRCGTEATTDLRGPAVVSCPTCGTEVPFAGLGGGAGDRIALADDRVPSQAGLGAGAGRSQARCQNCGADVPLRGTTNTEVAGTDPADLGDTVTCPSCGVEVAATPDQS